MDKDKSAQGKENDPTQQVKLLLIIVLVVAVAVPFVATQMAVKSISANMEKMGGGGHGEEDGHGDSGGHMVFYEPMEFLVNLADSEVSHYLRTTVSLGSELTAEEIAHHAENSGGGGGHGGGGDDNGPQPAIFTKFASHEPVIRDVIISVISTYPMIALGSSNGKQELKETIKHRLEKELHSENIAVYFTAFTLQ